MSCTNGPSVSMLINHATLFLTEYGPSVSMLTDHTALRQGPSVRIHHLNPHRVFYIDNGSTQNTEERS